MRQVAFAVFLLALAACHRRPDPRHDARQEHQAVLAGVAVECGLRPAAAKQRPDHSIYILIPAGTPWPVVDCVRRRLDARVPASLRVVPKEMAAAPTPVAAPRRPIAMARPDEIQTRADNAQTH